MLGEVSYRIMAAGTTGPMYDCDDRYPQNIGPYSIYIDL